MTTILNLGRATVARTAVITVALCSMIACGGDGDGDGDGGPVECTERPCRETVAVLEFGPGKALDLLFVIDNSRTAVAEQAAMTANFDKFVQVLETVEGGRPDLHVGVVSTISARCRRFVVSSSGWCAIPTYRVSLVPRTIVGHAKTQNTWWRLGTMSTS